MRPPEAQSFFYGSEYLGMQPGSRFRDTCSALAHNSHRREQCHPSFGKYRSARYAVTAVQCSSTFHWSGSTPPT